VSWFEALLLGIVQGLTEFFPVSSSGHLVLIKSLMEVHQKGVLFELTVHAATLVAVLLYYRKRIEEIGKGILRLDNESIRYTVKLCVATMPAVLLVLIAHDFMERQFDVPAVAGGCLLLTGILLWTTRYTLPRATRLEISWGAAVLIGCAQAFAILPGMSRSGATVVMALALGIDAIVAAEFSFLMSVLAIFGAIAYKAPELMKYSGEHPGTMVLAGFAALASGLMALTLFVRFLRTKSFHRFAYYVCPVGLAFLCWLYFA